VTGGQERRCRRLLDYLKERRGYLYEGGGSRSHCGELTLEEVLDLS
jgi:hypothetical protein